MLYFSIWACRHSSVEFAVYTHNYEVTGTFTQSMKKRQHNISDFRRISLEFSDNTVVDTQSVKENHI